VTAQAFATFGAAFLAVSALIAFVVFYVGFGLDRPTKRQTRVAAFLLLAATSIGYGIEWLIEVTTSDAAQVRYWAGLRTVLGVTLLNFAYAVYRDWKKP